MVVRSYRGGWSHLAARGVAQGRSTCLLQPEHIHVGGEAFGVFQEMTSRDNFNALMSLR